VFLAFQRGSIMTVAVPRPCLTIMVASEAGTRFPRRRRGKSSHRQ
jgi:hypothetical protein